MVFWLTPLLPPRAGGELYLPPRGTRQRKVGAPGHVAGARSAAIAEGLTGRTYSYRLAASRSFSAVQTAGSSAPSASPCSSSQRSVSIAARQPSPAAVTACL